MLFPSRIHLARAGLLLFLVGLWQLLWVWGLPAYVLGPVDIVKHFFAALGSEELYQHIGASLLRSLPGIVMFATEMINASSGLGHLIRVAESGLRFDLMYVSLVSIAILGYAGDRLLRLARRRVLAWQEQAA